MPYVTPVLFTLLITNHGHATDCAPDLPEGAYRSCVAEKLEGLAHSLADAQQSLQVLEAENTRLTAELDAARLLIEGNQHAIASNLDAITTRTVAGLADLVWVDENARAVHFEGANVFIKSGSGSTGGPVNGLGNLVVGYSAGDGERSGSHNLVVGDAHEWTSYGGLVAGLGNSISGAYASVCGGENGVASGHAASVGGGRFQHASGLWATVSGGAGNTASGYYASVSGGTENTAAGGYGASVTGGYRNVASSSSATVTGGRENEAAAVFATVSGGYLNTAIGQSSAVSGGLLNVAAGENSSVGAGKENVAEGWASSVTGGVVNTAHGDFAAVGGGISRDAGDFGWSAAGLNDSDRCGWADAESCVRGP